MAIPTPLIEDGVILATERMKATIELNDNGLCRAIIEQDEMKMNKYVSLKNIKDIVDCIGNGEQYKEDDIYSISPLCNNKDKDYKYIQFINNITNKSKWHILIRGNNKFKFKFNGFNDYINMPFLLFLIKIYKNRCVKIKIFALKNENIDYSTKLYKYPFSNVYSSGEPCLGNNSISNFEISDENITIIPNMFLSMDNSTHSYQNKNNKFKNYKDLLIYLKDNEFDNNLLSLNDKYSSYKDLINSLMEGK